jgi:hypothetical protein
MTFEISIKTNFPDVERQLQQLREDVGARALASTINKAVDQAKTEMSRQIRNEFNISASKVRDSLVVHGATYKNGLFAIEASLESKGLHGARSLNVINFAARPAPMGVSVKIKKGGGRVVIPGAFIGNQGRTVFIRLPGTTMSSRMRYAGTKHGQEIAPVQTIEVAQMFNTRRVNARVIKFIEDKLPALFDHEVQFYTDRFNRSKA